MNRKAVLGISIAVVVLGCVAWWLSSRSANMESGMIRQTGDYPSPSGRWVLKVRKAEKALRPYWIENVETQTSFKSDRTLSDAMRWGLLWEGDTRLWCYSGDIGTCVWTLDDKDVWTQHWGPYDQKFYQSMPTEVFDYLPPNKKQKLIAKGWTPAAINEK